MMIFKKWFYLFCFIAVLFSRNLLYAQTNPVISVAGEARPGGVLFLTVSNLMENSKPKGSWKNIDIAFFENGSAFGALLPVSRHTKPGIYQINIQIKTGDNIQKFTKQVTINPRWFAKQYLSLPKNQSDKYEDPELEKEYALLDKTLATVSKDYPPLLPFRLPVAAHITTNYGISRFINNEEAGWHKGIDLGAGMAAPITAPQGGKIILARKGLKIHGNTVVIDHGHGLLSLYLHLQKINVKEGATVTQGSLLGTVGDTGIATGPHLHWGTYIYGVPVDPHILIKPPQNWQYTASNSDISRKKLSSTNK